MRSLLLIVASFAITIFCWGVYGPVLHWGQAAMVTEAGHAAGIHYARLRPFVCVGLAYFAIAVAVPAVLLRTRGERGNWTISGATLSLGAGALGALGALGIILAFTFGGSPIYVMPLVFGGAPVVNSFLSIFLARKMKEVGPLFLAGLVMVGLGAVTVLLKAPRPPDAPQPPSTSAAAVAAPPAASATPSTTPAQKGAAPAKPLIGAASQFALRILSIAMTIVCWGAYGPTLHKGQAAMGQSRLRPLLCVGLAYFAIAVVLPHLLMAAMGGEPSEFNFRGTLWSLAGGAAGALGALGIILAFNYGGKPVYVMPLVFGGAPVVNTLWTTWFGNLWNYVHPLFLSGMILVVAGAAMVLVFAPKGGPPAKTPKPPEPSRTPEPPTTPEPPKSSESPKPALAEAGPTPPVDAD